MACTGLTTLLCHVAPRELVVPRGCLTAAARAAVTKCCAAATLSALSPDTEFPSPEQACALYPIVHAVGVPCVPTTFNDFRPPRHMCLLGFQH